MGTWTKTYLGDGVYAHFDGYSITLFANGYGFEATDRVVLEPDVLARLLKWAEDGHVDYDTGEPFR